MLNLLKNTFCILFAFGSGTVISGAIYAFISVIGVVPRLAQKTRTARSIRIYEEIILLGGVFGNLMYFNEHYLDKAASFSQASLLLSLVIAVFCLFSGIFFGCVTVSLAEVINVIPILSKRIRIERGLPIFILILAIGKLAGALSHFVIPGFNK